MSSHATWAPYTGSGAIILAIILFLISGALVFSGLRLRHPLVAARPGKFVGASIVVAFLLAGFAFLYAITAYAAELVRQRPGALEGSSSPIAPITAICGVAAFIAILLLTLPSLTSAVTPRQFWVSVGSAVVGAIAAPMIFELPYDLIVMWKTFPPTPASLYTPLFFLPLFVVAILSYAMVTLSPFTRLSRTTLFLLAGMFFIFAVWALFGFAFPNTPIPWALNTIGKVIAFAAAVSLFRPQKKHATARAATPTAVRADNLQ